MTWVTNTSFLGILRSLWANLTVFFIFFSQMRDKNFTIWLGRHKSVASVFKCRRSLSCKYLLIMLTYSCGPENLVFCFFSLGRGGGEREREMRKIKKMESSTKVTIWTFKNKYMSTKRNIFLPYWCIKPHIEDFICVPLQRNRGAPF